MKIFIPELGKYEGATLKAGRYYEVKDAAVGTDAQNKTFHALIAEYFTSGAFSYPAKSAEELKNHIKRIYGAGFDCFYAIVESERIQRFISEEEAKETAVWFNGRQNIIGHLKSWGAYTKEERTKTIEGLKNEMLVSGVNSPKFEEILRGME